MPSTFKLHRPEKLQVPRVAKGSNFLAGGVVKEKELQNVNKQMFQPGRGELPFIGVPQKVGPLKWGQTLGSVSTDLLKIVVHG